MLKRIVIIFLASTSCIIAFLTGCTSEALLDYIGARRPVTPHATVAEDGRETGGYVKGEPGEALTNVFFSFTVEAAGYADSVDGQPPYPGYLWLVAEITIRNTFGGYIPMRADDFCLYWGEETEERDSPVPAFTGLQLPDSFGLERGETCTGLCVFEVPEPLSAMSYRLGYQEVYDDGFQGNRFEVLLHLAAEDRYEAESGPEEG